VNPETQKYGTVGQRWPAPKHMAALLGGKCHRTKGHSMWALVIFTFATSSIASATVTTLEFNTQQLCLMATREFDTLTAPVVSEGVARYKVLTTCLQTSEVVKK
jgi:hypothetical protein